MDGYVYESTACLACHPTGDGDNIFDHAMTNFPLTGAHVTTECIACHATGYAGTPMECEACHLPDFNQSQNPNHTALGISTDCVSCHTTQPGWAPATFANHDNYYVLNGAHAAIANECASCHNGDYNNTPTTCDGCHLDDYNQTTDPDHASAQFPKDCASCHTETAWVPSSFNHDNFYPLTGEHKLIENECAKCHINGNYSNTPNSCDGCHQQDFNTSLNPNHPQLNLPTDCKMCHTTAADWQPADFPIHDDFWQLNGAHAAIANQCASCHNGDYNNTPTECIGCHQMDFNQTTNPNHIAAQFSTDCTTCHSETAWVPSNFDHDGQYFPIYSGEHQGEWDECIDCHFNPNDYSEFTCVTCHINPQTDNDHQGVNGYSYNSNACFACHPTGSADDNFDHNLTAFPLTGAHTTTDCLDCHSQGFAGTPTNCDACHLTDFNQTTDPNHPSLGLSTDCQTCHTTQPGWAPATFPDHQNYWVLDGAHLPIANQCVDCHNGDYNNTPTTCEGCHQQDYNTSLNPNHTALSLPTDCASCHTTAPGWAPAQFPDHNNFWQLNGAHAAIANQCVDCHNGDYNNTPTNCYGCHQTDYTNTTNPNHQTANFPTDCATCHTETAWVPATFDHNTVYPLTGAHATIANQCTDCHIGGNYSNTPNTCDGCHLADFNGSTNPNHPSLGLSTNCETCHTTAPGWAPAQFPDHNNFWVLDGGHLPVANQCASCHNGNYNNTPTTCEGCHLPDYSGSTNPNHPSLGLPTDCVSCHTTAPGWSPAQFPNHNNYWVIDGAHLPIANQCVDCHVGGNYSTTPNTCDGCHLSDYNGSTNPNHQTLGLPTDCESCHTTAPGWSPATFDIHDNYWVLDGAHLPIADQCVDCHNGNYNNTPNTCDGCHTPDYNSTTNPNHGLIGIPNTCNDCHTTAPGWSPATFDIHDNYWVLNGAHTAIANQCVDCHNGDYNNTPNTCDGCHITDYNATTNPDHIAAGFPVTCDLCHTETAWIPSTFDHNATNFPLTGEHISVDCIQCHASGYTGTPTNCDACHMPDYNATTNPNHSVINIPVTCDDCHSTNPDWMPATFDIHDNYWALNGAHANIANQCADCHNGNYNNTPTDCFGCHATDYNNATNPNHTAAGFPTTCESCHSETSWTPANWDHDNMYFPIFSGKHQGEWTNCNECHTTPGNFTMFSCIDCHEHNDPVEVADDHDGVSGYQYLSSACYACHPDGED